MSKGTKTSTENMVCFISELKDSTKVDRQNLMIARSAKNDAEPIVFLLNDPSIIKKEYRQLTGTHFFDIRMSSLDHYEKKYSTK
jgi:hypothetical protein